MDHHTWLDHLETEAAAFDKAVRRAADGGREAPVVPSCPGWSVTDLAGHLGSIQRFLTHILRERLTTPPDPTDPTLYDLPADPAVRAAWPRPDHTPTTGPVPPELLDWSAEAARGLVRALRELGPDVPVWTWSEQRSSGFWARMQAIEQAVHRWDAEAVTADPAPFDPALATDAVAQTFEVMAPARRGWAQAPPGAGERYRFRRTDGPGSWTVEFSGDEVRPVPGGDGPVGVEAAGSASDLMLFLWQRIPATRLQVTGDPALLTRWFTLVPPV
ncbi:maleylpyruvate isomerase family mycothiol-dependent enzyme [Streptomyces sp. NBC_00249]|uniref:maleylpyruvate isomerase family mycothiol-dependent enzyme n=1 Tax=Streptomyces sp. NBC_00249 TaxID=2975690 RepID=UPI0022534ED5|nr:maleylpyruvate isomerase family mycothiol-dependent enzyme [Streptomyces sp. NBC_00249]MCX5195109.1 maleylpyruvate isomerase family mycothiol-dependent enzyme [Streptomyces sp. NBC_00249]